MSRRCVALIGVAIILACAGGLAFAVVSSQRSTEVGLMLGSRPPESLRRNLPVFSSYVTNTGAEELLTELVGPADEHRSITVSFAGLIGRRAPRQIASDAEIVAAAAGRVTAAQPPSRSEVAAARRVDRYASAHCP